LTVRILGVMFPLVVMFANNMRVLIVLIKPCHMIRNWTQHA